MPTLLMIVYVQILVQMSICHAEEIVFSVYSCKYFLVDKFNERMNSLCVGYGQNLYLCQINIRSLKANLSQLESYMQGLLIEFAILGITETWLNESIVCIISKSMNLLRITEPQTQGWSGLVYK